MSNTSIVLFASAVWFVIGFTVGWCVTMLAIKSGKEKIQSEQENNNISIPTAKDALFLSSLVTSGSQKYRSMSKLFCKINYAIRNGQRRYNLFEDDIKLDHEICKQWTSDEIKELFKPYNYKIVWYHSNCIHYISWENKDNENNI